MKNRILILMLLVATLFACTSDSLITDDNNLIKKKPVERPFKINVTGTFNVFPGDGESCLELNLIAPGEGNATHLGLTTMLEEWCWNGGGSPTDLGTRGLTLTAANGDELWGTHSFFAFTSFDTFEEVLDFNGGTGRFKYATGQFNESVSIIYGDESLTFGTFTMTGEGTITY